MDSATSRRSSGSRLGTFLARHGRDARAIPVLGAVSVGDFFLPALPTQLSVLALGVLQPRRAPWIALTFATAAALGAALLALLIARVTDYAATFDAASLGDGWTHLAEQVRRYGLGVVLALSLLPTPPRLAVAATLLAGVAPAAVIGAVFLGKAVWFGVVLAVVVRSPQWLARIPRVGPALDATLKRLRGEGGEATR